MQLNLDFIRQQFPIFQTELGQKIGFFDNAGGSYPAATTVNRLTDFYTNYKVQPYGNNPIAQKAGEAMDLGRHTMADLLNVSIDELTIGASSTQNLNTLAAACKSIVTKDTEVIISEQDHEANIGGWERLCRQQGATLRIWKVDPQSGELWLEDLEQLVNDKTKVVAVTHSSNIIGTINPINQIAKIIEPFGSRLVVDGVSFAPHEIPNLEELKADAYVFSTYKTYGTHQGVMVVRKEFLGELDPQCHFFNRPIQYKWLDSAGPDHASIAALAGIGEYFSAVYEHHFQEDDLPLHEKTRKASHIMNAYEQMISGHLLDGLRELPLRIYGKNTMEGREATISLRSEKYTSKEMIDALSNYNIAAKNSHFYAYRLLRTMKVKDLDCLLYTSPSPRDATLSRMPSSA